METDTLSLPPSPYEAYRHTNGAYYAWILVDPAMLEVDAPLDDPDGINEEGEAIELRDFLLNYEVVGDKVLISLCKGINGHRFRKVSEDDLDQWNTYLEMNEITMDDWLTIADRNALMETE